MLDATEKGRYHTDLGGRVMTGFQLYVYIEYQIVSGKGGFHGQIEPMRHGSKSRPILPLESEFAKTIAETFAPEQAAKAKKEAEDVGPPVPVFEGTFNYDPTARPPFP